MVGKWRRGSQILVPFSVLFLCLISGRSFKFKPRSAQREFGVPLRNLGRVKLPHSCVSWWAWGDGRVEVHRLPRLKLPEYACTILHVESGSCVRPSLRDRTPYQSCERASIPHSTYIDPDIAFHGIGEHSAPGTKKRKGAPSAFQR